ncbi:hypothetical protein LTR70_009359 [Exophiala xenobiotica]|uniref:Uncharacterized protein n=1 Tax=Lithohypha guttulata TaxID=1690604 RepID=A0ABR0K0E9_9EURO|nr:hypothetical protein LTR24_008281 [Lithohypha guttulata]KAK5310594.1 hypothetical protein LTR70_009359 [Exophiala xenobiotica]
MSTNAGFSLGRKARNPSQTPSGARSLRSQAVTNHYMSRRGDAAAAVANLGSVQSGSVVDYTVCANSEAKDYRLYEIVEIPHLVLAMDPREQDDDYKVKTRVGEICPKWRPAVIVALYQERMTVLPIYSCKGNGVLHKPNHYKTTAISVAHPSMLGGSSAQYLTEEVLLIDDGWKGKEGQHINLNEPVSISYASPIVKKSRLDKESGGILYKRYRTAHHMGTAEPVSEHEQYMQRKTQEDKAATRAQRPKPRPQVDEEGFTLKSYGTTLKSYGTKKSRL